MPRTILVSESSNFSPAAAQRLEQAGRVIWADLNRPQLLSSLSETQLLWVRLRHQIDREVLDAAPYLRAIATPTTGLTHIDVAYAERRGIRILSLRGETAFLEKIFATAEHTAALALALVRHLPQSVEHVREGSWNRDLFRGRELHGKTAGIVGLGRIGRMVAKYFQAFGMTVLATDSAYNQSPVADVPLLPLDELLSRSDLVTIHVSLTDKTRGFFGKTQFARMKRGAWFLNSSRGELIDEVALLAGLQEGTIAGAALDVLSEERSSGMANHPLVAYARTHGNLLITPHIGGCTFESMEQTEEFLAGKVVSFLQSLPEEVYAAGGLKEHR